MQHPGKMNTVVSCRARSTPNCTSTYHKQHSEFDHGLVDCQALFTRTHYIQSESTRACSLPIVGHDLDVIQTWSLNVFTGSLFLSNFAMGYVLSWTEVQNTYY